MKYFYSLLFLVIAISSKAQVSDPYCILNNGGAFSLATVDVSTGSTSPISVIPGVSSYVLGNKRCIQTHDSTFVFAGQLGSNARLFLLSLSDGSVLSNSLFNNVVVGLRYNCNDSMIYAIEDVAGQLRFVSVEPATGVTNMIVSIPGASAYVGESFVLDGKRDLYHFLGLDGSTKRLYTIDISSGSLVGSPIFTDNLTGFVFNCQDSMTYALWEDASQYKLEVVDPVSGSHSTISTLAGVMPGFIIESATISDQGEFTYAGFDGTNNPAVITFDAGSGSIIHLASATINFSGVEQFVCCKGTGGTSTSVSSIQHENVRIYPNPADRQIFIDGIKESQYKSIRIYNVMGQSVFSSESWNSGRIDLPENMRGGSYFVEVSYNKGVYKTKLLIGGL